MNNSEIYGYKKLIVAIIQQYLADYKEGYHSEEQLKEFCLNFKFIDYLDINGNQIYEGVMEHGYKSK